MISVSFGLCEFFLLSISGFCSVHLCEADLRCARWEKVYRRRRHRHCYISSVDRDQKPHQVKCNENISEWLTYVQQLKKLYVNHANFNYKSPTTHP